MQSQSKIHRFILFLPLMKASFHRCRNKIKAHCVSLCFGFAESEGFEPPDPLGRSTDFESAPFDHSGNSPEIRLQRSYFSP